MNNLLSLIIEYGEHREDAASSEHAFGESFGDNAIQLNNDSKKSRAKAGVVLTKIKALIDSLELPTEKRHGSKPPGR